MFFLLYLLIKRAARDPAVQSLGRFDIPRQLYYTNPSQQFLIESVISNAI